MGGFGIVPLRKRGLGCSDQPQLPIVHPCFHRYGEGSSPISQSLFGLIPIGLGQLQYNFSLGKAIGTSIGKPRWIFKANIPLFPLIAGKLTAELGKEVSCP